MQEKLMLFKDWNDGDSYWRVGCDCSDTDHDIHIFIDVSDYGEIDFQLMTEVGYYESNWSWSEQLASLWKRITTAATILFKGRYTFQGDVVLNENGANALITALQEGMKMAKSAPKKVP